MGGIDNKIHEGHLEQLNDFAYIVSMQVKTTLLLVNTVALFGLASMGKPLFPSINQDLNVFCSEKQKQIEKGFHRLGILANAVCTQTVPNIALLNPEDFTAKDDKIKIQAAKSRKNLQGVDALYYISHFMQNSVSLIHAIGVYVIVQAAFYAKNTAIWQILLVRQMATIQHLTHDLLDAAFSLVDLSYKNFI